MAYTVLKICLLRVHQCHDAHLDPPSTNQLPHKGHGRCGKEVPFLFIISTYLQQTLTVRGRLSDRRARVFASEPHPVGLPDMQVYLKESERDQMNYDTLTVKVCLPRITY